MILGDKLRLLAKTFPNEQLEIEMRVDGKEYVIKHMYGNKKDGLSEYRPWRLTNFDKQTIHAFDNEIPLLLNLIENKVCLKVLEERTDLLLMNVTSWLSTSMEDIVEALGKDYPDKCRKELEKLTTIIEDKLNSLITGDLNFEDVIEDIKDIIETGKEKEQETKVGLTIVKGEENE